MTRTVIRYLFTLCILLLSGYSHLSAHVYQGGKGYFPARSLADSERAEMGTALPDQSILVESPTSNTKKGLGDEYAQLIEVEEEEDDKSTDSRKYRISRQYATTIFYALTGDYFSRHIKNRLSFYKQFSFFLSPPSRCIILQVFRI